VYAGSRNLVQCCVRQPIGISTTAKETKLDASYTSSDRPWRPLSHPTVTHLTFILSILSSKKKWMDKNKKTKLLLKFVENTNGCFIGAHQEYYDWIWHDVKLSGRNATNQRIQWTHSYMGGKLTKLYLLYLNFADSTKNQEDRRETRGGTATFFKGLYFQIKMALDKLLEEDAIKAAKATRTSLNLQKTGNRVQKTESILILGRLTWKPALAAVICAL
jgi:hypothetical protein